MAVFGSSHDHVFIIFTPRFPPFEQNRAPGCPFQPCPEQILCSCPPPGFPSNVPLQPLSTFGSISVFWVFCYCFLCRDWRVLWYRLPFDRSLFVLLWTWAFLPPMFPFPLIIFGGGLFPFLDWALFISCRDSPPSMALLPPPQIEGFFFKTKFSVLGFSLSRVQFGFWRFLFPPPLSLVLGRKLPVGPLEVFQRSSPPSLPSHCLLLDGPFIVHFGHLFFCPFAPWDLFHPISPQEVRLQTSWGLPPHLREFF